MNSLNILKPNKENLNTFILLGSFFIIISFLDVLGSTFLKIRNQIYKIIKRINWKYGFFRRDIGWRVIKKK